MQALQPSLLLPLPEHPHILRRFLRHNQAAPGADGEITPFSFNVGTSGMVFIRSSAILPVSSACRLSHG